MSVAPPKAFDYSRFAIAYYLNLLAKAEIHRLKLEMDES